MLAKAGVTRLGIDLSEFHVEELTLLNLYPHLHKARWLSRSAKATPICLKLYRR
jgi:hypothetical protein